MRTLVLYYSVTGHTRTVADRLADQLDATRGEIACRAYASGFGALRQAFDVLRGGSPPIELPQCADEDWDLVVIGGPVWGARPAPPVRSYLQRHAARHRRLGLFVTAKGTSTAYPPERAIAEMVALVPARPVATHIFIQAQIQSPALAAEVSSFVNGLGAAV